MTMDAVDKIIEQWLSHGFAKQRLLSMQSFGRIKRVETLLIKHLQQHYQDAYGIEVWEFDVLATLLRSGKPYCLSPTELFASMMITSGAMTNRLNRLNKKGLIERVNNPLDKRSLLVQLTNEGLSLINKAIVSHVELENKLLAQITDTELQQLNAILKKIEQSLN